MFFSGSGILHKQSSDTMQSTLPFWIGFAVPSGEALEIASIPTGNISYTPSNPASFTFCLRLGQESALGSTPYTFVMAFSPPRVPFASWPTGISVLAYKSTQYPPPGPISKTVPLTDCITTFSLTCPFVTRPSSNAMMRGPLPFRISGPQ
ncbi:unnamed protein product [Periconia digitata]|uniref:Uncharacterized protein n=1 Tax=Periconia digitata TaxID=1303443 RepID=A0A9W4UF28_9PLEO|nr:unnamed protein product [Periconia digitata]